MKNKKKKEYSKETKNKNNMVNAIDFDSTPTQSAPSASSKIKDEIQNQSVIPKAFVIESTNIESPWENSSPSSIYSTGSSPEVQILSPTPGKCPRCEINPATLALMPCGHLICDQCDINPCPNCGKKAVDAITVL